MLTRMTGLPENAIGFEASGVVTGNDYETVLMPAVEDLLQRHARIRFLYYLGSAFESFEVRALWDDARVGLQHLRAWERIAVVTDVAWIRTAVHAFAFVVPGELRIYGNAEIAAARQWLAEKEESQKAGS